MSITLVSVFLYSLNTNGTAQKMLSDSSRSRSEPYDEEPL